MDPVLKKQIEEAAARNRAREQEEQEEQEARAKLQAELAAKQASSTASSSSSSAAAQEDGSAGKEGSKDAGAAEKVKEEEEEDDGEGVCTFFKARKSRPGAAGMRKRAGKPLAASTKEAKKPRHEDDVSTLGTAYASTRSAEAAVPKNAMATAVLETETERDRDATAISERVKKLAKQGASGQDKVYRGQAAYTQYIDPGDTSGQIKGAGIRAGPVRASLYARAITRWDYQPDICKDYKETGYCGFGDACKFMHDRGDYKSGWELERDWNAAQAQKTVGGDQGEEQTEEKDDEDIPFACYVCRKPFTDPVKTKCGHFFCEKCALKKCKVECQVCAQKTGAAFSMPTRAERKKLEEARKKHEANPNKGNDDDDEEAD